MLVYIRHSSTIIVGDRVCKVTGVFVGGPVTIRTRQVMLSMASRRCSLRMRIVGNTNVE